MWRNSTRLVSRAGIQIRARPAANLQALIERSTCRAWLKTSSNARCTQTTALVDKKQDAVSDDTVVVYEMPLLTNVKLRAIKTGVVGLAAYSVFSTYVAVQNWELMDTVFEQLALIFLSSYLLKQEYHYSSRQPLKIECDTREQQCKLSYIASHGLATEVRFSEEDIAKAIHPIDGLKAKIGETRDPGQVPEEEKDAAWKEWLYIYRQRASPTSFTLFPDSKSICTLLLDSKSTKSIFSLLRDGKRAKSFDLDLKCINYDNHLHRKFYKTKIEALNERENGASSPGVKVPA